MKAVQGAMYGVEGKHILASHRGVFEALTRTIGVEVLYQKAYLTLIYNEVIG